MMEPITIATIVRSFASLIMSEDFSPRKKQILVILVSVLFFLGNQVSNGGYSLPELWKSLLEGCTAGLSAIGMYELTKKTGDNNDGQQLG